MLGVAIHVTITLNLDGPHSSREMRKRNAQTECSRAIEQATKKMTSPTSSYTPSLQKINAISISDEIALLDRLLCGFELKNDAQLAAWLGVDKSLIYATRAGKRRLGLTQRLKIIDHIGFLKRRSIVESIRPENLTRELLALQRGGVSELTGEAILSNADDPNVALIEASKLAFGYTTDAALAEFLEVEHNTLATVRAQKSALGPKPRLKILERITNEFDSESLISTLESSKMLIRLLDQVQQ